MCRVLGELRVLNLCHPFWLFGGRPFIFGLSFYLGPVRSRTLCNDRACGKEESREFCP